MRSTTCAEISRSIASQPWTLPLKCVRAVRAMKPAPCPMIFDLLNPRPMTLRAAMLDGASSKIVGA